MFCLNCSNEVLGQRRKFCSTKCNQSFNFHKYGGHEYNKRLRSAHPRNYLARLRSINKRKDSLSLDFLESLYNKQNGKCAITGELMTYLQVGDNKKVATNISLDRVDSDLDYTEDNIQLVCYRVNVMKLDGDLEELKLWCSKILNASKKDPRS